MISRFAFVKWSTADGRGRITAGQCNQVDDRFCAIKFRCAQKHARRDDDCCNRQGEDHKHDAHRGQSLAARFIRAALSSRPRLIGRAFLGIFKCHDLGLNQIYGKAGAYCWLRNDNPDSPRSCSTGINAPRTSTSSNKCSPVTKTDPYRETDEAARALARRLITEAPYAALSVLRAGTDLPSVSRVALATDHKNQPLTLISDLSDHTRALRANPNCALLIGEPEDKGDPLTYPRLTLHAVARPVRRDTDEHDKIRARYLSLRPKAKLYVDFADFSFVWFDVQDAVLNGGFGKAFRLSKGDL